MGSEGHPGLIPRQRGIASSLRVGAILLAGLLWLPASAGAQDPAGLVVPPQPRLQEIPVSLILNGEPKGDAFIQLGDNNELWLGVDALTAMDVTVHGGERLLVGDTEYVLVSSIPGARHQFELGRLMLTLNLPPESFSAQRRDLASRRSRRAVETHDDSLFVNYRVSAENEEIAGTTSALASEIGARRGEWLFLTGQQFRDQDGDSGFIRYQTQLVKDERDQARRWIVGDAFSEPRELGSVLALGGLTLKRDFRLQPYEVASPTASVSGAVQYPSEVEVYVGGSRIYREHLDPGAYDLRDFNYYGGRRDVRVVVRDALGQEQTVEYPYYFTQELLGPGLQEYSYSAGLLRENYGAENDAYGPFALSGEHHYGLNDHVLLGASGEYAEGRMNLGPEAAYRSDRYGVVIGRLAYGRDPDAGGGGVGASVEYQFQYEPMNFRASARHLADGYGLADPLQNERHVRDEFLVAGGFGMARFGYLNAQYLARTTPGLPDTRLVQLNYSRILYRRLSLYATAARNSSPEAANSFSIGVMGWFGDRNNASAFHRADDTSDTDTLQASNVLGEREGLVYRVTAEDIRQQDSETSRFSPYLEFNLPKATYIVETDTQSGDAGSSTRWLAAAQGSVYSVGDRWGFGRRVGDSYALARLTPPIRDVRVYQSGLEVGRTNAEGEVMIPGISSFLDNSISFDDSDVPIDYSIAETEKIISPPYRAGALVEFKLQAIRHLAGRMVVREAGGMRPLEFAELRIRTPAGELVAQTGRGGEFYLEDLAPGRHEGSVPMGEKACRFILEVPETVETVTEIAEAVTCEF